MPGLKREKFPVLGAAEGLHAWAVARARAPALYAEMGAPDTVEGRFELLTLQVLVMMDRLKSAGASAEALRQTLFDVYLSHLDGAMREMGVGDLAMGKRMRRLGESFYGRAKGFDLALESLPDLASFNALIARTVLAGTAAESAGALSRYVVNCRQHLAACADGDLLGGRVDDHERTAR